MIECVPPSLVVENWVNTISTRTYYAKVVSIAGSLSVGGLLLDYIFLQIWVRSGLQPLDEKQPRCLNDSRCNR